MVSPVPHGARASPGYGGLIVNSSGWGAQRRGIAIASSIPPSHAWCFWKTWTTTRGCRPSARSVARAWSKYASVYQPARIFSTGRSKTSGARRGLRGGGSMLELEARRQRGLGHLELVGGRLRRREAMLGLVSGLRECPGKRVRRVPLHPAEELGRGGDSTELGRSLRLAPQPLGCERGESVPDRGRGDEWTDQVAATTLVLARRALSVLVAADRDVLRAVIRGELTGAQGEPRRHDRRDRRQELSCNRAQRRLT